MPENVLGHSTAPLYAPRLYARYIMMPEMDWIGVKTELPPVGKHVPVFVAANNGTVAPGWWIEDHFEEYCTGIGGRVAGRRLTWVESWAPWPELSKE
jgi:hypothetical protein